MADAITILIAELELYRSSGKAEPVRATINNMVAAFQEIENGLVSGNEPANQVYAGPTSGAAAPAAFRALVVADLPSLAGTYLAIAGGTLTGTLQFDDGSQFSATGLAMAAGKTITPDQLAGIVGTTTNNNANAGSVGEYKSVQGTIGSSVGLTINVTADAQTLALSAGDWDVWGTIAFFNAGSTVTTLFQAWLNTVSATAPASAGQGAFLAIVPNATAGSTFIGPVGRLRISLAAAGTVYLSVVSTFISGASDAYGFIGARRVR